MQLLTCNCWAADAIALRTGIIALDELEAHMCIRLIAC